MQTQLSLTPDFAYNANTLKIFSRSKQMIFEIRKQTAQFLSLLLMKPAPYVKQYTAALEPALITRAVHYKLESEAAPKTESSPSRVTQTAPEHSLRCSSNKK